MTPRHHRVGPGIFRQPWDDDTKLVAFYILTNQHRITEGLYRLPPAYAWSDMGWKTVRYERAFRALVQDGFIEWDQHAEVVWIVRALEWQQPQNPNQVKAAVKALQELPANRLLDRFLTVALTIAEPKLERFQEGLREAFAQRLANTPTPTPTQLLEAGLASVSNGSARSETRSSGRAA